MVFFFFFFLQNTAKPPNWQKNIWELDPEHPDNNGFLNTDFIVWMRTAALPSFRKLYRKLSRTSGFFFDGLPSGNYELEIVNSKFLFFVYLRLYYIY